MTVSKKSFQDSSSYIIFELWFLPWFHIERRGVKEFLLILLFIYLITFSFVLEGDGLGSIESGFGAKFCSFVTSSFSCTFGLGMGTKLFASHWINASYEVGLATKIPVSRVNYSNVSRHTLPSSQHYVLAIIHFLLHIFSKDIIRLPRFGLLFFQTIFLCFIIHDSSDA